MLLYAGRELAEQLPRNYFNHSTTELDYFSDKVYFRVNDDQRASTVEWRDFAQHRDLRRSGSAGFTPFPYHPDLVSLFVDFRSCL